jgi:ABC-type glycerol-3-phosphate transport system permease component
MFVFAALIVLGSTMVVPFLITVASSSTNDFDYNRFAPVPKYFWSSNDRFMKGLVKYFNTYRGWAYQLKANMEDLPSHWASWLIIGQDETNVDKVASQYLKHSPEQWKTWQLMSKDYSDFCESYPIEDSVVAVLDIQAVEYLRAYYEKLWLKENPDKAEDVSAGELRKNALALLNKTWGIPFKSFYNVEFRESEMRMPIEFQSWYPPIGLPKYDDFLKVKAAYKAHMFTPGVKGAWFDYLNEKKVSFKHERDVFPINDQSPADLQKLWLEFKGKNAPASPAVPFALRAVWYKYLESEDALTTAGLKADAIFNIEIYNQLAGTDYKDINKTPFPIPAAFKGKIQKLWSRFIKTRYPLRLTSIEVNPKMKKKFSEFLKKEIKYIRVANELLGTNYKDWSEFELLAKAKPGQDQIEKNRRSVWMNFAKSLPINERTLSSSEIAYQKFLLKKYGSLEEVNKVYNWNLKYIEEAFPSFAPAYTITFLNHQTAFTLQPILANYRIISDFLIWNSRAVQVTFLLVALTILATLTVNPIAAYAMSRFNLKGQDKIILFMLATMAFPAMVSAIPAYLLMRDLGLLNTFFALVLPTAANGMAIFILKGFFDSLPLELFEAATIDGASEFQIFRIVAMPLVKPILAINCLTAFIMAYNGWQWALIICQKESMWTIAVWLYQASIWWGEMPWLVSAGFVVASIPTFIIFVSCQKIIMRGIIIPSMK